MSAVTLVDAVAEAFLAALAGTTGVSDRIFEDRTAPFTKDDAPALQVTLRSGEANTLGDNGPARSILVVDGEIDLAIYTRSAIDAAGAEASARSLASPIWASAHAKLMLDPSLGGLTNRLRWKRFRFERDGADGAAGWTVHTYEFRLAMREQTLLAP